jgi:hypothetical protein
MYFITGFIRILHVDSLGDKCRLWNYSVLNGDCRLLDLKYEYREYWLIIIGCACVVTSAY